MEQDDKIRQYVMKKQQQRERAQHLRNQRRTQPQQQQQSHSSSGGGGTSQPPFNPRGSSSFANKNRIIGDPFAPNNENIDRNNGSVYNNNDPSFENRSHYDKNNSYDNSSNAPVNKYALRNNNNNNKSNAYNNNAPNDYNPRYSHATPFAKMSASDFQQAPQQQNIRDNNTNDDYNDYNNNFNRAPSSKEWQTTPMPSKTNTRQFATNQSKYNQNNAQNNAQNNNNYRGFNAGWNKNERNERNNNPYARNNNRNAAPQYSPTPPINVAPKEIINDAPDAAAVRNNHSRAESNDILQTYATCDDVKKVVSMVEQLRGQMHALQFQIDNVKIENTKLKETIAELEEKQKQKVIYPPNNQAPNDNYARNKNQNQAQSNNNQTQMQSNNNNAHFNNRNNARNNNNNHTFGKTTGAQMDIDNDHISSNSVPPNNNRSNVTRNATNNNNGSSGFPASQRNEIKFNFDNNTNKNNFNNNANKNNFNNRNRNNFEDNNNNNNNNNNNFNANNNNRGFNSNNFNPNNNFNNNNDGGYNSNSFNNNNNINEEDENEREAPPKSSAADLIKRLEQEQGAFVETEQIERVQCNQCGRKFARQALERHTRICKKVFGQKRKAFNMKNQRADDEALSAQRNTDQAEIEKELKRKKAIQKAKWKSQSSMLRQAIKQSKQIEAAIKSGKSLSDIPQMQNTVPDHRVPCPHCGRKFAEETAKRHIPKCQNIKSRPKALKRRR